MGRPGAGDTGGEDAELGGMGWVVEGSWAIGCRGLEGGLWFGGLTARGWVGGPGCGGRNEADEGEEPGEEEREAGEEHCGIGCRTYSDSVHCLSMDGKARSKR